MFVKSTTVPTLIVELMKSLGKLSAETVLYTRIKRFKR